MECSAKTQYRSSKCGVRKLITFLPQLAGKECKT